MTSRNLLWQQTAQAAPTDRETHPGLKDVSLRIKTKHKV